MSKFLKSLFTISILGFIVVMLVSTATPTDHDHCTPVDPGVSQSAIIAADSLIHILNQQPATVQVINTATSEPTYEFPRPVTRLTHEIYIDCPAALEVFNPDTDSWQIADYLEPEFEVPPENVLWVVESDLSYRIVVDFGDRAAYLNYCRTTEPSYSIDVIYSSDLKPGALGNFCVELCEFVNDTCIVYCGEIKCIADEGAQIFCNTPAMDSRGNFTANFSPRTSTNDKIYSDFLINSPFAPQLKVRTVVDNSYRTVYSTNLANYLYPHGVPEELKWYFDQFPITDTAIPAVGLATD